MSIPHAKLTGVKEDASYEITGVFKDLAGVAIPKADLTTVRMWLKDKETGATINSRADVNILGSVDVNGNLNLELLPADNPILVPASSYEVHILTIEWTWNGGARKSHAEIHLYLDNSTHVPTSS